MQILTRISLRQEFTIHSDLGSRETVRSKACKHCRDRKQPASYPTYHVNLNSQLPYIRMAIGLGLKSIK